MGNQSCELVRTSITEVGPDQELHRVLERRSMTSHHANLLPSSSAALGLSVYPTTTLGVSIRANSLGHPGTRFLNQRETV